MRTSSIIHRDGSATEVEHIFTNEHDGFVKYDGEATSTLTYTGLEPVIDKVMPLEAVIEAERMMEERRIFGKIVLTP